MARIPAHYRYVVIDTPPVLAASEALVLAKAADASLVSTMRDVSRMDQVRYTIERLATAGCRPVGTVLNGVPTNSYVSRYGDYADIDA
jgi:polysaccharide biosynthesis transport protein